MSVCQQVLEQRRVAEVNWFQARLALRGLGKPIVPAAAADANVWFGRVMVLDNGVVGATDQGADGVLYEGRMRGTEEAGVGVGWSWEVGKRRESRSWCLGQAFLTKSSLGGEATGSRKTDEDGATRLLQRAEGQLERQSWVRKRASRRPNDQTNRLSRAYGLVSRADGSLDTHSGWTLRLAHPSLAHASLA